MAFVIAIYQMFLPFIAVLLVYISIIEFSTNANIKNAFKKILTYFLYFIISCIVYFLMVKLTTFVFNIDMNSYQHADSMFDFSFNTFFKYLGKNLVICFSPKNIKLLPSLWYGLLIGGLVFNQFLTIYKQNKISRKIIMIFMFIILIIAPQVIRFVKPTQWFHEVTLIPYTILYAGSLAMLFYNLEDLAISNLLKKYLINVIMIITGVICISFVIIDNKASVMAKNASDSAFYFANRMQMRIEQLDGYSELPNTKKYYFIGKYRFYEFPYSSHAYEHLTGITTNFVFYPPNLVDAINVLGINAVYYNTKIDSATEEKILAMANNLDVYPDGESMFIYHDIVVIKLR